jgi:hypothetical protein
MIRIKENYLDEHTIALEVDGVLDQGAVPVLKSVCEKHLSRKRSVLLNLEGLVSVTREGRAFLNGMREKVRIDNLPEFMSFQHKTEYV